MVSRLRCDEFSLLKGSGCVGDPGTRFKYKDFLSKTHKDFRVSPKHTLGVKLKDGLRREGFLVSISVPLTDRLF